MSLLDDLKKTITNFVKKELNTSAKKAVNDASKAVEKAVNNLGKVHTVTFQKLPENVEELKVLPEARLSEPYMAAALTVAALCRYPQDKDAAFEMLDFLNGPGEILPFDKQFLNDRFMDGKDYVPRSFFEGATPENDYTPSKPLTLKICDDAVAPTEENYRKVFLTSGGADSPRQVTLRLKPSTKQWFLHDQLLLGDIRIPQSKDEWA